MKNNILKNPNYVESPQKKLGRFYYISLYLSKLFKYKSKLLYHRYKFGIKGNIKVLLCRTFGHRLSEDKNYECCHRCGLAYSEIYYNQRNTDYISKGIKFKVLKDKERKLYKSITYKDIDKASKELNNL